MITISQRPLPIDYEERVYAGWLGKCIGVRFGAPLEGWTYQEIRDNLGELDDYLPLPPGKVFKPDDDTAFPMILVRALQDYGPAVSAEQLGETMLNYLGDQRGTLWWGGYGVSTEHTAYLNLAADIPAPLSGSIALNGAALAEQIGGQIFSDIWGLVVPDNPELAAGYAARAASISHDGNAVYGGRFIAGLVSAAFSQVDPQHLIEIGLGLIPADSEYSRVVRAVLDFHAGQPDDWHAAYRFINDNFGYDRYPGVVHIIPNTGVVIMALLYGQGDFSRTIQIANMGGWDTDCNVGNVGAITGVAVGLQGISPKWREPMNDELVTASLIGTRNLLDIPACADLFCALGRQIAGESARPGRPRYHFSYPGSTQGFHQCSGSRGKIISLRQIGTRESNPRARTADGPFDQPEGALQLTVRKLNKKSEVRFFVKTSLRPDELSANYYGASFSPKIYPGQQLRARLFLPPDAPEQLQASLFAWDDNHSETHQSKGHPLQPGRWHDLRFQIPALHNACLSEVGVLLRNLGQPWSGSLSLGSLDWDGSPSFSNDFGLERPEYDAISQWTFLRGFWRLDEGGYHGSGVGVNETYTGDIQWQDYSLSVRLTPLKGDHHNINVRVSGALRSYAAGLAPDGKVVLYRNDRGYRQVSGAAFPWQHGCSTLLTLAARDNGLIVSVDGQEKIFWTDDDQPYRCGQIGLSNFAGCRTCYEFVEIS
ncbi:MAG: ADP-ribosylglycohydrolase family protein [Chloroflexota bacterium]|nr:ADP-ribosylglycohydrolase family protein [Chloroflexota bacterium]